MQRNTIYKILITIAVIILIIIFSNNTFAITPDQIKGTDIQIADLSILDKITDLVRMVGTFIAVGVLMVIGIRYVMGSIEERASYKRSMMPYIIGCFILFGATYIAPNVKEIFTSMGDNTTDIGNSILGLIQVIGTLISVGTLMVMGIRYMMGSVEERASYKKSMVPYIIGVILIFGAVNIAKIIYNLSPSAKNQARSYYESVIEQYGEDNTREVTKAMQDEMKSTESDEYKDAISDLLYKYSQQHMGQ